MKRGFVLDTSVLLKYAAHDKLHRLLNIIATYNIVIYANETLMDEVKRNLPRMLKNQVVSPEKITERLLALTTFVNTNPAFTQSPDPKDNFLFDLALQTDSEVIVSDEKKLLLFKDTPVPVRSLGWFKETFPVEL